MKIITLVVSIIFIVGTCLSTELVHFQPYSPSDTHCSNGISGFGFIIPMDICVGNSDLVDLPGSYFVKQWNSTAVMLYTYINIYFKTDCSGNPTSEFPYLMDTCNYDQYEGSFDETNYRYVPSNVSSDTGPTADVPPGSILYSVFDKSCENVESFYYITNNTVIGPNTDIPMTYYCTAENNIPMQDTCYKGKCQSYSLQSKCGSFENSITVSCT
ncbi:hypothetical protein PPL_10767 [Heterostelium album PN500]|uniref:Uncharacterized protein n=1 Tax=Heterostelium pallidum (strain ATCC 26659 / Pp 5 / PN500) TaxID=670386 RepID=D3BRX7_HETP5|nr:hypothetical protein PPL_10767 [Heterostelium album PN500]EFA75714.1 hypothetical protein PPL_10767 [Heterostelium album PN500]|eukprot:XP_020427848.1 hypothetical protein PPL_10767 [Heterostelium album PN500]